MPDDSTPSPRELLRLATAVAEEAVDLVRSARGRESLSVATKSSPTDLVTETDQAAEELIRRRLGEARPRDAIVGEEGGASGGSSAVRWVVDPIDGTTNFLYGHPGFAVSIAAEVDGQAVAGVVRVAIPDETFTAALGGGAHRNGEPIAAGRCADPAAALVATGFAYDPARRVRQGAVLARVIGEVRDVRRMGAASVDLCSVACGRVDAYWERGLNPWDHAAGALIATEAGARVADLNGGPAGEGCLLAANPQLWDHLAHLLAGAGAADA